MADQPTTPSGTPSGSRWEPTPEDTDGSPAVAAAQADPVTDERRAQLRGRAVLAGAATALTLGGGLAGFVIGHSTAGDDANGFRPANFSGQQPGGQLGDGTQQGPPSFGDHDGDGDGGGFGQPPQGSNGSSDGTSSSSSGASGT